jgi:hypothetical protein
MVSDPFRIFRMTNVTKGNDASQLNQTQKAILAAREALEHGPAVDTFLGRKTQEPFPMEER